MGKREVGDDEAPLRATEQNKHIVREYYYTTNESYFSVAPHVSSTYLSLAAVTLSLTYYYKMCQDNHDIK